MKPAIFNTEMVRAILDGRKTQTRRIASATAELVYRCAKSTPSAPYQIGSIIYVRETWGTCNEYELFGNGFPNPTKVIKKHVVYRADNVSPPDDGKWKPSIHMPKEYARLFLRVKDIHIERLNEISEEDIIAEGCAQEDTEIMLDDGSTVGCYLTLEASFRLLWESIYGDGSFDNRYVWVIEFEKISKEEALSESKS